LLVISGKEVSQSVSRWRCCRGVAGIRAEIDDVEASGTDRTARQPTDTNRATYDERFTLTHDAPPTKHVTRATELQWFTDVTTIGRLLWKKT